MCLRRQAQLQKHKLKGVVYYQSKKLCKKLVDALDCPYYYAGVVDQAERLKAQEEEGGLIIATLALGTRVNYLGIMYIMHVGMLQSIIDFTQESGQGGRASEVVDSVILVEHGEVEQTLSKKGDDINVQAIGVFIISSSCRQLLISQYLDRTRVSYSDMEALARCDRCRDGIRQWLNEQESSSQEQQQVQELFNELRARCVVYYLLGNAGGYSEWQKHRIMQCTAHLGVTRLKLDRFCNGMRDQGGIYSCQRCQVSQKYYVTQEGQDKLCQQPNVVVPLVRTAAITEEGEQVI